MSNSTTPWLDTGDNAWQLTAGSLVALQSVPGLVVLYAGFMRSKWAINSAFMAFYAFAATLITWVLWAYKIGFGIYMLPFAGRPGPVVTIAQELKQSELPSAGLQQNFPLSTMIYFQFLSSWLALFLVA
ncbi:Ammonium transporter 2 [Lachnellula cervina]|uniref:Ammonium transporter 2 n=1 Tax=Lachnellula cervina TaxID=1316786 RepID=A0A7D8YPX0_9HELO|nr:Ammonium transporter 2 [Lachnellula cervina]